jgi:hypothetical protein
MMLWKIIFSYNLVSDVHVSFVDPTCTGESNEMKRSEPCPLIYQANPEAYNNRKFNKYGGMIEKDGRLWEFCLYLFIHVSLNYLRPRRHWPKFLSSHQGWSMTPDSNKKRENATDQTGMRTRAVWGSDVQLRYLATGDRTRLTAASSLSHRMEYEAFLFLKTPIDIV